MEIKANLPTLAKTNDLDAFLNSMASLEQQSGPKLRVTKIQLAGKEGKWYEEKYDEATKAYSKSLFQDFSDASFTISPLLMAFFCKWKHEDNARESFVTSEFLKTSDNPLDLYKVTFKTANAKSKQETLSSYADYQEFKAKHASLDTVTGKMKAPYDFYISLYAFHHQTGRVIKMEFKGASRAAWFDFQPELSSNQEIRAMCQAKIRVGINQGIMKTGEDYYMASFRYEDKNSDEAMQDIMSATNDLIAFLNFKQRKNKPEQLADAPTVAHEAEALTASDTVVSPDQNAPLPVVEVIKAMGPRNTNEGEEIRLEDIPF